MTSIRTVLFAVAMSVALASVGGCAAAPHDVGALLHAAYPEAGPGAALIVVRNGSVVYRGAAGMAHLELGVAMRPEHKFKIYSVILRDGAIFSQHSRGEPLRIYPIGDDLFGFEGSHTWLRFEREGGRVVAMQLLPRLEPAGPPAARER